MILTKDLEHSGAEFDKEFECKADNGYTVDRAKAFVKMPPGPPPGRSMCH